MPQKNCIAFGCAALVKGGHLKLGMMPWMCCLMANYFTVLKARRVRGVSTWHRLHLFSSDRGISGAGRKTPACAVAPAKEIHHARHRHELFCR